MKQECKILNIYLNWILYLGVLGYLAYRTDWALALAWGVFLPLCMWIYVRIFPTISRFLGYGRLDDKPALDARPASTQVNFYTALGCPFCPVVEQRLRALQERIGFSVEKIDVTLKPDLLTSKGIRSVPVVEVGNRRLVGHATTEQLSELIRQAPDGCEAVSQA